MRATRREAGFSLLELIVAMAITLIISGAIYGLMAGGQNAFRREPALTDRQQNIRVAMALIQSDLQMAGQGLPALIQTFVAGNQQGPATPTSVVDWSQGQRTDVLNLYADTGMCEQVPADPGKEITGTQVNTAFTVPACYPQDAVVMVMYPGVNGPAMKPGFAHKIHSGGDDMINFPAGLQPPAPFSLIQQPTQDLGNPETPIGVAVVQWVRWQIANEDPACTANCVPALYRSSSGGWDISAGAAATPGTGGDWQLVARGIEDLQIRYRTASMAPNTWVDDPPSIAGSYDNIVQEVQVTLSARTTDPNIQGSTSEEGATAVRGQLVSSTSPRSALFHMAGRPPSPSPGGPLWR